MQVVFAVLEDVLGGEGDSFMEEVYMLGRDHGVLGSVDDEGGAGDVVNPLAADVTAPKQYGIE